MAKTLSTLNNLNVDQKVLKGGFKVLRVSEFLSYKIELRNGVTENGVTFRLNNSNFLHRIFFWVTISTS